MQTRIIAAPDVRMSAVTRSRRGLVVPAGAAGRWRFRAFGRRQGKRVLLWEDYIDANLVVTEGRNRLLSDTFKGATQTSNWFLGLTDGSPTVAAGDTLASHAGWAEVSDYAGDRKAWTHGSVSDGELDNVGNEAEFVINDDAVEIGGAFLTTAESGTSGVLYAAGAFVGGNRTLNDTESIEVTATMSITDGS